MSKEILCPHCYRSLSGSDLPGTMTLMCPYCQQLFTMSEPSELSSCPSSAASKTTGSIWPAVAGTVSAPVESVPAPRSPACGTSPEVEAPVFVVYPNPRPFGVTLLALLGIIFTTVGLLAGLVGLINEAAIIFGWSQANNTGSVMVLIRFSVICLFMMGFFQICLGLLRRKKSAHRAFCILAVLIILIQLIHCFFALREEGVASTFKIGFFEGVALLYLLVGLLYLQLKRVKNWFS